MTAQKREESMQDVAISLAAFSGEQMAQLGITNATDLVMQGPAGSVGSAAASPTAGKAIRSDS